MQPWGLIAAKALNLDTSQYDRSGSNIHNTGEFGWYQGKGVVNATPITFAEFFAALPKVLADTMVTTGAEGRDPSSAKKRKLDTALAMTRKDFLGCNASGARVIFVGNGGSAAIASHMAVDYSKNGGIRAMAFNDVPTLTCLANDYGYDRVFEKQIEYYANKNDTLVIISSSGRSLNLLAAANAARIMGCHVVTLTGMNPNNRLRALGDWNFWVPSADYGLVELSHLTLLHAIASIRLPDERAAVWKKLKKK